MTLVPNETEQALNRQHDVYAAAREEYRKKIAEQAAEIEKLRAAISWIEPPFVDDSTSESELRSRIKFCVADAKRAALEGE